MKILVRSTLPPLSPEKSGGTFSAVAAAIDCHDASSCHHACASPCLQKWQSREVQPSNLRAELYSIWISFSVHKPDLTFGDYHTYVYIYIYICMYIKMWDLDLGSCFKVAIQVLDPGPQLRRVIRIYSDSLHVRQVDLGTPVT